MTPPKKGTAGTLPLEAEQRRRRVEAVRALAEGELRGIENMLLDAQARIPTLLNMVRQVRTVIEASTAPASEEGPS